MRQEDEFIILGYSEPSGSRKYFGSLLFGAFDKGKLKYLGKVTDFTRNVLASFHRQFQPLKRKESPLESPSRLRNARNERIEEVLYAVRIRDG